MTDDRQINDNEKDCGCGCSGGASNGCGPEQPAIQENEVKGACCAPSEAEAGESCCAPSEAKASTSCCAPTESANSCACSGFKGIVFTVVMIMAVAVGANSFFDKTNAIAQDGRVSSTAFDFEVPLTSLDSVEAVAKLKTEKDVVFVVLTGSGDKSAGLISKEIETAIGTLADGKISAATYAMSEDSEAFKKVAEEFGVQSFPAVLLTGKGVFSGQVKGNLTSDSLLSAFFRASSPACCPSDSSETFSCT